MQLTSSENQQAFYPTSSIKRLDTVIRLSQRMESLINSLLHYSQVGRTDLSFREVELKEVLENVLESLRHQIEESKVDIIIPRPLPKIFCDKVRIAEVFSNLISNSIKYNDKPEKSTEIGFLHRADEATVFYVKDNGIGIKPEFYDTVFKFFVAFIPAIVTGEERGPGLTITKE